jgi:hypothetical protein
MKYDLFYISTSKIDQNNWSIFKSRFPNAQKIEEAKSIDEIKKKSFTKMFWIVWDDIIVKDDFNFEYEATKWANEYEHVFKNGNHFNGICLFPKTTTVTSKEFKYRFFINKKEVDILVSTPKVYDVFNIDTYEEYQQALEQSSTDMFWMSSKNLELHESFKFDVYFSHHNSDDRNQNHAFINRVGANDYYNGLFLCTKSKPLSKKEVEHRFPIHRREWLRVATVPNVYKNYSGLVSNYEEYKEMLERSVTELFWLVPNDVNIDPTFDFTLYFTHDNDYDRKINHIFLNIAMKIISV